MRFPKQKIFLTACLFLALFTFAFPAPAQARGLVPCGGYSDDKGTRERPCNVVDAFALVARVTNWLIGVAGLYAVYKIIGAGFWLIVAVGDEEKITVQKATATDAVVGLVLVMLAFLFINFVTNFVLTRSLVSSKPECKLNLSDPLTYLNIDQSKCNSLPDNTLHTP